MADDEKLQFRAEIFRSKLIEHFRLLDTLTDNSSEEVPKYYSDEVKDANKMDEMMRTCSNALVKFQVYTHGGDTAYADRRLNRIKTKSSIPMGPWAKMVVQNNRFQNFMLILIISNSIALGIQAEISTTDPGSYKELKVVLDIFDLLSLMAFVLEILLKWIDGFFNFWKNGWNVYDFFVTVMSFAPELIKAASPGGADQSLKIVADNLRTFRVLRSLKMVSRFAQLRIIVLTMLKALKSMAFILILLATFMYIFAVTGTVMFTAHHKSTRTDLSYKYSFSNLVQSLLTLFQLFTLDNWFQVLTDLGKTSGVVFSKIYIILWICVGAFIFKNVFTGIMVMNFQNIRNEFVMQCKEQELAMKEMERQAKLEEDLARQYRSHSVSSRRRSSAGMGQISNVVPPSLPGVSEDDAEDNEEWEGDRPNRAHQYKIDSNPEISTTGKISKLSRQSGAARLQDKESASSEAKRVKPAGQSIEGQLPNRRQKSCKAPVSTSDSGAPGHSPAAANSREAAARPVPDHKPCGNRLSDDGRPFNVCQINNGNKMAISAGLQEESRVRDGSDRRSGKSRKQVAKLKADRLEDSDQALDEDKFDLKELKSFRSKNAEVEGKGKEYSMNESSKDYRASEVWNRAITANLPNLKDSASETLWPRDSLFRYFQLIEALQDNLAERGQLQKLAFISLNQMHDGKMK